MAIHRIEFRLDDDDPTDAAIWAVLQSLSRGRRMAGKVRELLAKALRPTREIADVEEFQKVEVKPKDGLLDDILAGLNEWGR